MDDIGFNPRSPRGGATWDLATDDNAENVSIHAPHEGERRSACRRRLLADGVSIHAPHEGERRIRCPTPVRRSACFNPRSPRGGATTKTIIAIVANMFQSTLPTRGSDYMTHAKPNRATKFQSTLPTRGSDSLPVLYVIRPYGFNPRSPRGGATKNIFDFLPYTGVSIHAPHEGERLCRTRGRGGSFGVSIHAPHEGERPVQARHNDRIQWFQSTLPTRGSDANGAYDAIARDKFQSTLPTRGSDVRARLMPRQFAVSIHAPHEGERQ